MRITILGAHAYESASTRLSSILIDDRMALDAGGLTSGLSFEQQRHIEAILLTHGHYDHIRDVPAFALKNGRKTTSIYATRYTLDILTSHLIDGILYPDFTQWPSPERPALRLNALEPLCPATICGYDVLAVPVPHALPSVGYQVTDSRGRSLFYTGDTGPGLSACWEQISPQVLIVDMNFSNRSVDLAPKPGHMCPMLLQTELIAFHQLKGYFPLVILTHMNPDVEREIAAEAEQLAHKLGVDIHLAFEGMELS